MKRLVHPIRMMKLLLVMVFRVWGKAPISPPFEISANGHHQYTYIHVRDMKESSASLGPPALPNSEEHHNIAFAVCMCGLRGSLSK